VPALALARNFTLRQGQFRRPLRDRTSILQFIEDNWNLGRIGGSSFDAMAGSLLNMFEFADGGAARKLFLDPATGQAQ
jgi:phospholipase C